MFDEFIIAYYECRVNKKVKKLPFRELSLLIHLILQSQIIRYHRNKFRIRGFSSIILDSVAEIRIEGIFAFTFREKYAIL